MDVRSKLLAALVVACLAPLAWSQDVVPDVVYGHKDGLALTLDVIRPTTPSGAGLIWLQSGGWYSAWVEPTAWPVVCKPFLDKGVTVFVVRHGSAPRYAVPDAFADVRRSVRFIRLRAATWSVDKERLAVMGGSAGGHLALLLGTRGDEGNPSSPDEVERQSSKVAAVVALMPPTDLRGWVQNPPEAIKKIPALKPPLTFDPKLEPELSPLLHVTATSAPTLLVHGDKDELVPVEHSRRMHDALDAAHVPNRLVVVEGAGHGFSPPQNEKLVAPAILEWLDRWVGARNGVRRLY
jgi:acetyl esterase/lipase